jgi:hypothetical protein
MQQNVQGRAVSPLLRRPVHVRRESRRSETTEAGSAAALFGRCLAVMPLRAAWRYDGPEGGPRLTVPIVRAKVRKIAAALPVVRGLPGWRGSSCPRALGRCLANSVLPATPTALDHRREASQFRRSETARLRVRTYVDVAPSGLRDVRIR